MVYRKHLYVADEVGDVVKVFSVKSGELMAHMHGACAGGAGAPGPAWRDALYRKASGSGSILALDLTFAPPRGKLKARVVIDRKLGRPSAFCGRPRRRFLCGRAQEAAGAALFL